MKVVVQKNVLQQLRLHSLALFMPNTEALDELSFPHYILPPISQQSAKLFYSDTMAPILTIGFFFTGL